MTDTTEPPAETLDDREAVARIINPSAWPSDEQATAYPDEDWDAAKRAAFAKTDAILAALTRRAGGDAGAVNLAALIEPWKNHHGPLPDYDSPIACVFDAGVQYAVELLAKELGVTDWTPCDGTEEYDGDLGGTLMNIVREAMPLDQDGERMWPSEVHAALTRRAGGNTPAEWTQIIRNGLGVERAGCWRCGALSEALARILSLDGHAATVVSGTANGERHVWVEVAGEVFDPTAEQFASPITYIEEASHVR